MKKFLRWAAMIFGAILLLAICLFGFSRCRGATVEEKAALALMEQPDPPPTGRNAFAALWLLSYDIPEAELESVAAADIERFKRIAPFKPDEPSDVPLFVSTAEGRYKKVELTEEEKKIVCNLRDAGCLEKIRGERDTVAMLLEKKHSLIVRADRISQYGFIRGGFEMRVDMPFVVSNAMDGLKLNKTLAALDFIEGRTDKAMTNICSASAAWRRFMRSPDLLIDQMIGEATLAGAVAMFSEMLAELPPDYSLPTVCAEAFSLAPLEEISICAVMKREFAYMKKIASSLQTAGFTSEVQLADFMIPVLYDTDMTRAAMAKNLAWACSPEDKKRVVQDQPPKSYAKDWAPYRSECWSNQAGCMLTAISTPAYQSYQSRMQDHGVRLKMINTLLWLRSDNRSEQPMNARLAARPIELKSPTREVEIGADGKTLSVRMLETDRHESLQIPLPRYLVKVVPTGP